MDTYIVYFDETGDDGANTCSSNQFVLTGMYMSADSWQDNYDKLRACRKELRKKYGLFISQEIHTKHLVRDKGMYREYNVKVNIKLLFFGGVKCRFWSNLSSPYHQTGACL